MSYDYDGVGSKDNNGGGKWKGDVDGKVKVKSKEKLVAGTITLMEISIKEKGERQVARLMQVIQGRQRGDNGETGAGDGGCETKRQR